MMNAKSGGCMGNDDHLCVGVSNTTNGKGCKTKIGRKPLSSEEVLLCSHLEKLKVCISESGDHVEQIRNTTTRVLNILKINDITGKLHDGLPLIVKVLKTTKDADTVHNLVQIFEIYLMSKPARRVGNPIVNLLGLDVTGALFGALHMAKSSSDRDNLVLEVYGLLSKLSGKDPETSVKLKKSDTTSLALSLIRKHSGKLLLIRPLLLVIKSATTCRFSSSYLGKEGIVPVYLSLLNSLGSRQSITLKLVLETIQHLTKSKCNCKEIVSQAGVQVLLKQLDCWDVANGANRFKILRANLCSLNNLADSMTTSQEETHRNYMWMEILRSTINMAINLIDKITYYATNGFEEGKNAIIAADGITLIYQFCQKLPLSPEYDAIMSLASGVALKCLPRRWLPLQSGFSAVTFAVEGGHASRRSCSPQRQGSFGSSEEDDDDDDASSLSSSEDDNEVECSQGEKCSLCIRVLDLNTEEMNFYRQFLPEIELVYSPRSSTAAPLPAYLNELLPDEATKRSTSPVTCGEGLGSNLEGILTCFSLSRKASLSDDAELGCRGPEDLAARGLVTSDPTERVIHDLDDCCKTGCWNSWSSAACGTAPSGDASAAVSGERQRIAAFLKGFQFSDTYQTNAQRTRHVVPFVKLAYPDMHADSFVSTLEPLHQRDPQACRAMLFQNLDRLFGEETNLYEVVYDYDVLISGHDVCGRGQVLTNEDHLGLNKSDARGLLKFESRFESGNLRKAIMIGRREYELILNPDINCSHHHQWFYFEVSNMESGVPYSFDIVNCEKGGSQFNLGMKPLLYSVREATLGRPGWVRAGSDIVYYRNHYSCPPSAKGVNYFTTHFTIVFQHSKDVCYIAYHYPYTYSLLQTHLHKWENEHDTKMVFFRKQSLCYTLSGNELPLLTITSKNPSNLNNRSVVVLTGRVHPGETNASWVMKGTIDFLLSDKPSAEALRDHFVFKIVPMLNPDGVVNGCHRCSLSAQDLNRCWLDPSPTIQPTIYRTKRFIQYLKKINKLPLVYCDYHGHSRRKNVFLYGCNGNFSWLPEDRNAGDDYAELLPRILHHLAPSFSLPNSTFTVERNRESTARVTVWRQMGVRHSFTMESSYCGCDQGPYKDFHLGITQLTEMGLKFCQGILHLQAKLKSSYYAGGSNLIEGKSSYHGSDCRKGSLDEDSDGPCVLCHGSGSQPQP